MITAITGLKWEMFVSVGSKLQHTFLVFYSLCATSTGACETHNPFHASPSVVSCCSAVSSFFCLC